MIYDCIMLNHEIELLTLRMAELDAVVDRFIVVEGLFTFSGMRKGLFFDTNRHLFTPWAHKIDYHVTGTQHLDCINQHREDEARRTLKGLVSQYANNEDTVIFSDLDEVPDAQVVKVWARQREQDVAALFMPHYHGFLNLKRTDTHGWIGGYMAKWDTLKRLDPNYVRLVRKNDSIPCGWHFSYTGGLVGFAWDCVANAFVADQGNAARLLAYTAIKEGTVLMGWAKDTLTKVPIETLPKYVTEQQSWFTKQQMLYTQDDIPMAA